MNEVTAAGGPQPDSEPVRYGVIGTGMMGIEHIHNINAIEGACVVAVSDPDDGSRAEGLTAAEAGGGQATGYADHIQLLDHSELDAVVVASPNFTHLDVVSDVLESGHHVLVEKPMCITVDRCLELIDRETATAEANPDRVVQVGLEYRYMPAVSHLVDEVGGGAVGRVRMVAIREHRFPFLVKVGDWNRFSANTGGTLVEKCCHFFDLMNLILAERPSRVMASGGQDVNHLDEVYDGRQSDILDNAYVIVDYPSGARAMLDLCMFAEATRNQEEVSVVGDIGKAEALIPDGVFRLGVRGRDWIGEVADHRVADDHIDYQGLHHGSSYLEHLDFLDAVAGRRPVPVTTVDGLWSVAMGQAAHLSIAEGRPVELGELSDRLVPGPYEPPPFGQPTPGPDDNPQSSRTDEVAAS
jgi:predicted dehydrogenase